MKNLIDLFKENFRPYGENPMLGLTKKYIADMGYCEEDINKLTTEGKIEAHGTGYRMTSEYKKLWSGSSYRYIQEYAR